MSKQTFSVLALTRAAMIAAIYTVLTLVLAPISYGVIQVRLSEILTLLPLAFPEAIPGVAVGCLLANLFGGSMLPDIVFGTLATLLAAICTRRFRKNYWVAASMPVLFNGIIVGAVVHYCYTPEVSLPLCMISVAAGEAIACLICGTILYRILKRTKFASVFD